MLDFEISELNRRLANLIQLKRFAQNNSKLSITMAGNMKLSAERKIELTGFREGVNGLWVCQRVSHELSASGFVTQVQAERFVEGGQEEE